jgi:hypothetical protein
MMIKQSLISRLDGYFQLTYYTDLYTKIPVTHIDNINLCSNWVDKLRPIVLYFRHLVFGELITEKFRNLGYDCWNFSFWLSDNSSG